MSEFKLKPCDLNLCRYYNPEAENNCPVVTDIGIGFDICKYIELRTKADKLKEYARHNPGCQIFVLRGECTCGLADILGEK